MSLEIRIDGVLIEDRVRLTGGSSGGVAGFPAAAYYGQIMTAGVQIDDPGGTLDVHGWHVFTADETACSKPRIFTGWITGTKWSRPPGGPNIGPGRVIDCDIVDQNALFGFEVFRSTAASIYPAQTDLARIEQARASHAMAGTPIVDNGRVSSDDPVNLTSVNFVGRYPGELFTSTAGEAGKQFYAYWDDAADEISLHYAPLGEGPAASWGVSNVIADVDDDTVFFPMIDGQMARSPDDVNTGLLFGYSGGRWVYARNETLIDELSPTDLSPVNFLRDKVYQTDRVGLTSTANALVTRYLANMSTEDEVITFTVRVPASKVNLAHAGDLIPLKFTHLEGYETEISRPILRRNVIPSPGRRDMYDITFECSGEATQVGPGGGTGGETPQQNSCDMEQVQSKFVSNVTDWITASITLDSTPTPGNLLVMSSVWRGVASDPAPTGWTPHPSGVVQVNATTTGMMWYKTVQSGDSAIIVIPWPSANAGSIGVTEWSGAGELADSGTASGSISAIGEAMNGGAVDPTVGLPSLVFGMVALDSNSDSDNYILEAGTGYTTIGYFGTDRNMHWTGYREIASPSGSYNPNCNVASGSSGFVPTEAWGGRSLVFSCAAGDIPSPPHVVVPPRPPTGDIDGSNQDFTTDPFDPAGNTFLLHDGIDQTPHLTVVDATVGSFSIDYAPSAGSELRVGTQTL